MTNPATNLTEKLDEVQAQLVTQHNAMMARLQFTNDLLGQMLVALGGAPPAETTTLGDVLTAVQNADTFSRSQRLSILTAIQEADAFSREQIDDLYSMTDNRLQNIYRAVIANDPCACDENAPDILPPALETLAPVSLPIHCQRVQAFLDMLGRAIDDYIVLQAGSVTVDVHYVSSLYASRVIIGAGVPLSVYDAQIIAQRVSNDDFDLTIVRDAFNANKDVFNTVLYNAANASAGNEGVINIIDTLDGVSTIAVLLALFTPEAINRLFDQNITMNVTGYSDTACTPVVICETYSSVLYNASNGTSAHGITFPTATTGVQITFDVPVVLVDPNISGYSITPTRTCTIYNITAGTFMEVQDFGVTTVFTYTDGDEILIVSGGPNSTNRAVAFSIELCTPGT